jgi:hypothetical protein
MELNQVTHDRQAETEAAISHGIVRLAKALKDVGKIFTPYADAIVADDDIDLAAYAL